MSSVETGPLLLDTHYWIWFHAGEREQFTPRRLAAIQEAANEGQLLLSAISVWELGLLESKGRIHLQIPCQQLVEAALAIPGLTLVPLTPAIALDSSCLPGTFPRGFADRIIAATARRMGARLLTRDQKLLDYASQGYLRTI